MDYERKLDEAVGVMWRPIEAAAADRRPLLFARGPIPPGETHPRYGVGFIGAGNIIWDWPYGGEPTHFINIDDLPAFLASIQAGASDV